MSFLKAWATACAASRMQLRLVSPQSGPTAILCLDCRLDEGGRLRHEALVTPLLQQILERQLDADSPLPIALLDAREITGKTAKNREFVAHELVLVPECLLNVQSFAGCFGANRVHPFFKWFFERRFLGFKANPYIYRGNLLNEWLAALVNSTTTTMPSLESIIRGYHRAHPGEVALLPPAARGGQRYRAQDARADLFDAARPLANLLLQRLPRDFRLPAAEGVLEAFFLCPWLGFQGKLDCFFPPTSVHGPGILELKSGKNYNPGKGNADHETQTLLYAGMVRRAYPAADLPTAVLLYPSPQRPSAFPAASVPAADLVAIDPARSLHDLLVARNELVATDLANRTPDGLIDRLQWLFGTWFGKSADARKFFPSEKQKMATFFDLLGRLKASPAEADYFSGFFAFGEREYWQAIQDSAEVAALFRGEHSRESVAQIDDLRNLMWLDAKLVPEDEGPVVRQAHVELPASASDRWGCEVRDGDGVVVFPGPGLDQLGHTFVLPATVSFDGEHQLRLALATPVRRELLATWKTVGILAHRTPARDYGRGLWQFVMCDARRRALCLGQQPPVAAPVPQAPFATRLAREDEQAGNASLCASVRAALAARDYYLLVGPPGTGKTSHAMRNILLEELARNPEARVFLMAFTNRAVDVICGMLEDTGLSYLRMGNAARCEGRFRARLMDHRARVVAEQAIATARREGTVPDPDAAVRAMVDANRVFVCTTSSFDPSDVLFRRPSLRRGPVIAIVDEASQILEPQLAKLFCATADPVDLWPDEASLEGTPGQPLFAKLVMIGDPNQLPAVVAQSPESCAIRSETLAGLGFTSYGESLFVRLYRRARTQGWTHAYGQLTTQFRMHPLIAAFASQAFYGGILQDGTATHQQLPPDEPVYHVYDAADALQTFLANHRIGFFPTPRENAADHDPQASLAEARRTVEILRALYALRQRNGLPFSPADTFAVVVPYKRQVGTIRSLLQTTPGIPDDLKAIEIIDTVERVQGGSMEIVLYSTVAMDARGTDFLGQGEADNPLLAGTGGFASGGKVNRKLNVACTRARTQFFVIGDARVLATLPAYAALLVWLTSPAAHGGRFPAARC